jgi:hypothetical protein
MLHRKTILLLAFVFVLSGCGELPIASDLRGQLESLRPQVTPGDTSRSEVHDRLGQPFISSKRWPVEVYRVRTGHDVSVHFAPIPLWVDTEDVIIYALVVYDKNDIVTHISWDIYEQVAEGYTALRKARLEASGFLFVAAKEAPGRKRKEILLALPSEISNAMHDAPAAPSCAVLFFYPYVAREHEYLTCEHDYFLDGERVGELPLVRFREWLYDPDLTNVFSRLVVDAGDHAVKVTTSLKPEEFGRKLVCEPGSLVYVYPRLELVETEPWGIWRRRIQYKGEISLEPQPPELGKAWKQLLFYNGQWLGEK